eukprot:scpid36149/ scgid10515/ 
MQRCTKKLGYVFCSSKYFPGEERDARPLVLQSSLGRSQANATIACRYYWCVRFMSKEVVHCIHDTCTVDEFVYMYIIMRVCVRTLSSSLLLFLLLLPSPLSSSLSSLEQRKAASDVRVCVCVCARARVCIGNVPVHSTILITLVMCCPQ